MNGTLLGGQLEGGAVRLQVTGERADDDPVPVPRRRRMGGASASEPGGELAGVQLGDSTSRARAPGAIPPSTLR
jgi:hypothetical protein